MPVNIGVNIQRSPNRINQQLREAGVEGKFPKLLLDFKDQYYLASGGSKTLANAVTHARSGNAVMTDGYGPELVVNGSYSDGTTGWTASNATLSVDNGELVITSTGGARPQAYQTITTVIGKTYEISAIARSTSSAGTLEIEIAGTASDVSARTASLSNKRIYNVFVATSTSHIVQVKIDDGASAAGETAYFDSVSVREMPVLKWAPHNLCRNSEDATASNFFKSNVTVTSVSSVTAPNGTTGVSKYEFAGAAGDNVYITDGGADIRGGVTGTFAVFAKAVSSATTIRMRIWDNGSTGAQYADKSVSADDWTLLTHEATTSSNSTTANFAIYNNSSGNASDIYVWGFHIFRSDLGGMVDNPDQPTSRASYVPTTSSAKYLPRIGHHVYNGSAWVNEGLLAESEARTNLLTYSDFSGGFSAARVTKTANQAVSPDGNENASELVETTDSGSHFISVNSTVTASVAHTLSCYVKQSSGSRSAILRTNNVGSTSYIVFDFATETITETGSAARNGTVQNVGNGWYRIAFTYTQTSSTLSGYIVALSNSTTPAASLPSYTGDGSSGIYIYGGQIEQAETPSSLVPTGAGSTVTRAAETFTIPSANLPWPEPNYIGSELVTNGTFDSDISGWTDSSNAGGSIAWNASGYLNLVATTDTSRAQQSIAVTTGNVYAVSLEVVSLGGSTSSGLYLDGTVQGGSFSSTGTLTFYYVAVDSSLDVSVRNFSTGTTVSVDNVSVRELAHPLSVSIAMDGRITYADEDTTVQARLYRWQLDGTNRIVHRIRTDGDRTGDFLGEQEENDVYDTSLVEDVTVAGILQSYNFAQRSGSTFIKSGANGVVGSSNVTPTALPDLSATDLDIAYDFQGTIGTFRVWDRDIGDTGLVEATNPSLEPSLSLTFEGTGTNSFVVNDWSE